MTGDERRQAILELLKNSKSPLSGTYLASELEVSRQVIVQDVTLLRAKNHIIHSTHKGYVLEKNNLCQRVFKVKHSDDEVENELTSIVDLGGIVQDVFVYHKVYNVIQADLNVRSRRDVRNYMEQLRNGTSTTLMNVTGGYHYHTVIADTEDILDEIQDKLEELGYLAKLQEYEPVDFWK